MEIQDDWADMLVVTQIMADLVEGGHRFYAKDNGQAMVLFCLDEATAARINQLSNGALARVAP